MTAEIAANMARIRREQIRWYLLVALNVSRPVGAPTQVLLNVVQSIYADATEHEIRLALDYLADRKLVTVQKSPTDRWHCELTRLGVDIVEYTVDIEAGIARPKYAAG